MGFYKGGGRTHVFPLNFLTTQLFDSIENPRRRHHGIVRENHFVLCPRVNDDLGDVFSDVSQIGKCAGRSAVADQLVVGGGHGIVDFAGGEARSCDLVPPADVDDGVCKFDLFDVVVYFFFLRDVRLPIHSHTTRTGQVPHRATT